MVHLVYGVADGSGEFLRNARSGLLTRTSSVLFVADCSPSCCSIDLRPSSTDDVPDSRRGGIHRSRLRTFKCPGLVGLAISFRVVSCVCRCLDRTPSAKMKYDKI